MVVGVPAVATAIGANCDIVRDGFNGFLASNQSEFADKLCALLGDAALRSGSVAQREKQYKNDIVWRVNGTQCFCDLLARVANAGSGISAVDPGRAGDSGPRYVIKLHTDRMMRLLLAATLGDTLRAFYLPLTAPSSQRRMASGRYGKRYLYLSKMLRRVRSCPGRSHGREIRLTSTT